jgi:hypothetical protein
MRINIGIKNQNKSGWVQLILLPLVITIVGGVVVIIIDRKFLTPTPEQCKATAEAATYHTLTNPLLSNEEKILQACVIEGVYLCCLQGLGEGYKWDYITSKCLSTKSNS